VGVFRAHRLASAGFTVVHTREVTGMRNVFVVVTLLALVASSAAASPSDDARAYHEKAKAAFALEKYTQAAESFERAFELKPDPAILYNAALSHRLAGNKERALGLYQNYLRVFGHVGKWMEVETRIDELKKAIAQDHAVATSPPTTTEPLKGEAPEHKPVEPPSGDVRPTPPAAPPPATGANAPVLVARPADAEEARPLTSRPLFWVGVGAGVAAVATVVLFVALSGTKDPVPSMGGFTAGN
jgi:hypothetical protein